jgi:hypothetical protein
MVGQVTHGAVVTEQQLIGPIATYCIANDHDRTLCRYERVQLRIAVLVSIRRS